MPQDLELLISMEKQVSLFCTVDNPTWCRSLEIVKWNLSSGHDAILSIRWIQECSAAWINDCKNFHFAINLEKNKPEL